MIESPGRGKWPHGPYPDTRPDDADRLRRIHVPAQPGPERDEALEAVARKEAAQARLAAEREVIHREAMARRRMERAERDTRRAHRRADLGRIPASDATAAAVAYVNAVAAWVTAANERDRHLAGTADRTNGDTT